MKKTLIFAGIIASVLMLSNCSKQELALETVPEPAQTTEQNEAFEAGKLVSSTLVKCVPAECFIDEVLVSAVDTLKPQITELYRSLATGIKWQIETYRIQYTSLASDGKPAVLTGDVSFICDACHILPRELNSVSLYHMMFNLNQATTEMQKQYSVLRAFHNALVVCPLYQGAGADKGKHLILVSEPFVKAQQAIDCELAALELIDSLNYVHMDWNYYTENMGLSNGASVALATQYEIERECDCFVRDRIRLVGTFCGSGCYDYGALVADALNLRNLDGLSGALKCLLPYAVLGCIAGTCDTWLPEKSGMFHMYDPYFYHHFHEDYEDYVAHRRVEDYFSDALKDGIKDGEPYSILDHLYSGDLSIPFLDGSDDEVYTVFEKVLDPFNYRDLFSKNLFVDNDLYNGDLDMNKPLVKDLFTAFDRSNFFLLDDWIPCTPVTLAHSLRDDMLPYETARKLYHQLSRFGLNRLVSLYPIPCLDHSSSAILECIFYVGIKEHPCTFINL